MKNVKIKDFRQGVTLYYVMAFPLESKGGNATVETYRIQSRAYLKPMTGEGVLRRVLFGTLWYDESHEYKSWSGRIETVNSTHSITDSGVAVGKTNYNFHRVFKTRNQAQRYADRMNSGCLTHEERQHAIKQNRQSAIFDDYDWHHGWDE